jgi:phosphoribosylformylglycinamidine synthase
MVPKVDPARAKKTFQKVHEAIKSGLVRACHDLSEGGLAVAAAEMAFAGGLGMSLDLAKLGRDDLSHAQLLFSESNTRFLVETDSTSANPFQRLMEKAGVPAARLGTIESSPVLAIRRGPVLVLDVDLDEAKAAWQKPLHW